MKNTYTRILELELNGFSPTEIADKLEIAPNTVYKHRNKDEYKDDLESLRQQRSNRKGMSLQNRAESLVERLLESLEEAFDRAETVEDMLKHTDKLKEVVMIVGKPQQVKGESGVVVVPELLSPEAFNHVSETEAQGQAPQPILLAEADSLALHSSSSPDPESHEASSLSESIETYPHECESKTEDPLLMDEWPDPLEEDWDEE